MVDQYGQPVWQRSIGYIKFDGSNNLYRYQEFDPSAGNVVDEVVADIPRAHQTPLCQERAVLAVLLGR